MARYIYFNLQDGKVLDYCDTDKYNYPIQHPEDQKKYITDDGEWNNSIGKIQDYFIIPQDNSGTLTYVERAQKPIEDLEETL